MPSFKEILSDSQLRDVAVYVAQTLAIQKAGAQEAPAQEARALKAGAPKAEK
jgi:mono/diheme cytochrome c family protein